MTAGFVIPGYSHTQGNEKTDLSYGTDWTFDSTLKIYVCSSVTNTNSASCTLKNLNFWYTYPSNMVKTTYFWGISRKLDFIDFHNNSFIAVLIANYLFKGYNQSFVTDLAQTTGFASLGTKILSHFIKYPRVINNFLSRCSRSSTLVYIRSWINI